jgi:acyl transferase domain-containing protein/acyl-CoA synthetase (AMP-forming)/AMP-acid ligase II/SAM-dependent methyltransferase/acyl carrier protein
MTHNSLLEVFVNNTRPNNHSSYTFLRDGEALERTLTHFELLQRARRLAAWLSRNGFAGQRAMMVFPAGLEFVEAFLACLMAQVITVPVAPVRLTGDSNKVKRMQAIMQDCQPALVLGVSHSIGDAPAFVDENPQWRHLRWLALDEFPEWESPANFDIQMPSAADVALLQYTSGSTGSPKGVMLSHRNILYNLMQWDHGLGHDDASRMVCWVPHFHDLGLLYGVLFPMYRSISAYLLPGASVAQNPLCWLKALSDFKGTHSMGPNFIYNHCYQRIPEAACQGLDLSSWRMALNAAEPIRAETVEQFNRKFGPYGLHPHTLTAAYGLAEATCIVTGQNWESPLRTLLLSTQALQRNQVRLAQAGEAASEIAACGQPLMATTLRIVDPVRCIECAADQIGEIWISSDAVSSGYWNRPEESTRTFGATLAGDLSGQCYLRTGDLGFMQDGDVFTTGRIKDILIVRGENYYPQDAEWEVEQAHRGFKPGGCAVFSILRDGEEKIVVVQELMRNHRHGPYEEMFGAIRRAVGAAYDLPVEAMVLIQPGTTAKTSSGKIQRSQSRQAFLDGSLHVAAAWDPRSPTGVPTMAAPTVQRPGAEAMEQFLIRRITEISKVSPAEIRSDRPFSEYGLGSLESTTLAAELAARFKLQVSPTVFYDHPNVRRLVNHLGRQTPDGATPGGPSSAALPDDDAIVVVGLACRFPGAGDAQAYWTLLREGRSGISARTYGDGTTRHGGFLEDLSGFDNGFFSITKREAGCMDPQQRMALEVSWQALEDAGIKPDALAGSPTGVFFGASAFDYGSLQLAQGELDAYSSQGSVLAVIANRIAYHLDLRGPSFVVDTACSSALSAVHLACRSLRDAECRIGIVGAVNVLLADEWDRALVKAGMLAPDGQCKTFDASADGYVRSEGCGVLVLKRYKDAVADGDRIYGAILGSAMNQDGRSNGLTAPNGSAQEALVAQALAHAKVGAAELQYVEAHGTGTPLGDPIECKALLRVLQQGAGDGTPPCHLGSAKANVGHLEAAAGMAGLIKTLLALHHQEIPMQRNLSQINPLIDLGTRLSIPGSARRCASVSAFGFSGANACVVVGDVAGAARAALNPAVAAARLAPPAHALPFVLSARDKPALRRLAASHASHVEALPEPHWPHFLYTRACRRTQQAARFAVVAADRASLAAQLRALADGSDLHVSEHSGRGTPRIAFVYSGQGVPLKGAARTLFERLPAFSEALARCDRVLAPLLGHPLETLLYEDRHDIDLSRPSLAQPVHFSVQYALSQALLSFGIEADVTLGHSLGEYAALVSCGVMPVDTALRLVAARGSLCEHQCSPGTMVAVFADEEAVRKAILLSGAKVDLAAINGQYHCVVAGDGEAVAGFCAYLAERHTIEHRKLHVERGYHSALVEPVLPAFMTLADEFEFEAPDIAFISNVTGRMWPPGKKLGAHYFARHLREPVRFTDSLDVLADANVTLAIEIGTKPVLCSIGEAYLDSRGPGWQPLLRHGSPDHAALLECLLRVAGAGVAVDWLPLFAADQREVVSLPAYDFEKISHWFPPRASASASTPHLESRPSAAPLKGTAALAPWDALLQHGERVLGEHKAAWAPALSRFEALWKGLEAACPAVMAGALAELGVFQAAGEVASAVSIGRQLGFKDSLQPLLGQWLATLCAAGWLQETGHKGEYRSLAAFDRGALQRRVADLLAGVQTGEDYAPFIDYVKKAAVSQVALLKGEVSPLELLFPDGESKVADALYQFNPVSRMQNHIAVEVLRELVGQYMAAPHASRRPMRILELGAGTGGTSASLLGALPRSGVVYHFTDVSHFFIDRAKARFADLQIVDYGLFDINKGPAEQGYELASFDLVVAANAVHTAKYIDRTLRQLRELLVPGGSLMFVEGTANTPIQMLTLAHIESFSHYQDRRKADNLPFMSVDHWRDCLLEAGFARFAAVPGTGASSHAWPQHVLLARTHEAAAAAPSGPAVDRAEGPWPSPPRPPLAASSATGADRPAGVGTLEALSRTLAKLIHVEAAEIDPQATLMELGVDSIVLMEFSRVVGRQHGVKLSPRQIFEHHPSLAALAHFLDTATTAQEL